MTDRNSIEVSERDKTAGIIFCALPTTTPPPSESFTTPSFSSVFNKKNKDKEQNGPTISSFRVSLNEAESSLRGKGIPEVKAATLEKLVSLLLHPSYGTKKFKKTAILMHSTFCTSIEVFFFFFFGFFLFCFVLFLFLSLSLSPLSPKQQL